MGDVSPDIVFNGEQASSTETQNGACMSCHRGDTHTWWAGSAHDDADLGCTACHTVHVAVNPVADPVAVNGLCYQCHTQVRSAAKMRSRHPIEEGRTACVDCHNPHGSSTEALLAEPTLNDNCYRCHAEKRGPFLFEHAPVTEDCGSCHQPHGSINDALLTVRTPFLCQQCHSAAFHPSLPTTGSGLPGGAANQNLLSKNCLNCHSQVHGSNHPSGGRMTR
jgi:DmsE family decaheme c-type cytochrome